MVLSNFMDELCPECKTNYVTMEVAPNQGGYFMHCKKCSIPGPVAHNEAMARAMWEHQIRTS